MKNNEEKNKPADAKAMAGKYNPREIEPKWMDKWEKADLYKAVDFDQKRPKKYILVEFPYPSGAGLHPGAFRSWGAMDAFSRKLRMQGFNVLYPMGWDAFGLPAENYAIRTGIHPSITAKENVANFKRQCRKVGLSFDWSREIDTTDPAYYRWTQWIFLKLLEKDMAYQAETQVNWCPFCKTTLADEEVLSGGIHERCGKETEKRMQKQWLLRITKYADRLIEDLKEVDYSSNVSVQQVNWIGKKEWIDIEYQIEGLEEKVVVATTRPDTNYGATFIVLAPEHPLVGKIVAGGIKTAEDLGKIKTYVIKAKNKSELARQQEVLGRDKTGTFTGLYAINPLTKRRMPIWIADFVLMSVGTGAVVGVPGHDIRDFEFAQQFGLDIVRVVVGKDGDKSPITEKEQVQEEEGTMTNSGFLDGLDIHTATEKIMDYIEEKGWGKRSIRYHMRDWIFSRQHYWGEPIPVVHCEKCGVVPVPEDRLPVELPYVEKYQPSGTGESPLATMTDWVNTTCPKCGGSAKRETDTMPNWAGSNWYFLAYLFPDWLGVQNSKCKIQSYGKDIFRENKDLINYWMPVDVYQGGFEHTTLHVLYSRFIYKFLYDIGVVPTSEPYKKRRPHGILLGSDGRKMSKSFNNTVDLDETVDAYGADTMRIYEAFMGPFDQMMPWSQEGIEGSFRFLKRVWNLVTRSAGEKWEASREVGVTVNSVSGIDGVKGSGKSIERKLHQTIKKVTEDIEEMKFNTAIASLMEFLNEAISYQQTTANSQQRRLTREIIEIYLKLLAPFAPFMTEELWEKMGNKFSIHQEEWPEFDADLIEEDEALIVIQVNGKMRDQITIQKSKCKNKEEIESIAREREKVKPYLVGGVKRTIFIPGRLVNFVV